METTKAAALTRLISTDAKLTKSEVMDLLLEEMLTDLEAEQKQVAADLEVARSRMTVTFAEVAHLARPAEATIDVDSYFFNGPHRNVATFKVIVPENDPILGERVAEVRRLRDRQAEISNQVHKLQSSKAALKTSVLRSILESTPEGKEALAALSTLKVSLRAKILPQ